MSLGFKKFLEAEYTNGTNWGNKGAGVLVICKNSKRILMQMRSQHVNEPSTWGVIGGAISGVPGEKDSEDAQSGAEKELREETGYKGSLKLFPAYLFQKSNFSYQNFIGIVPEEFEPNIPEEHKWETAFMKWMTFDEMLAEKDKFHFGLKALLNDSKSLSIIKNYVI